MKNKKVFVLGSHRGGGGGGYVISSTENRASMKDTCLFSYENKETIGL